MDTGTTHDDDLTPSVNAVSAPKTYPMGVCQECGKPIELKMPWKKFCNSDCRLANWIKTKAKSYE